MVKLYGKTGRLKDGSADQRILAAARQEFIACGLRGARMQAIADRAGVNKALLHYYFRSKERLYDAVLRNILGTIGQGLREQLPHEKRVDDLRSLLRQLVTVYVKTFQRNPDFPRFMLREMADGGAHLPGMADRFIAGFGDIPARIAAHLVDLSRRGRIRKIPPLHVALNIVGMCVFAFIARPVVNLINEKARLRMTLDDDFWNERIDAIVSMACDGLFKENRT